MSNNLQVICTKIILNMAIILGHYTYAFTICSLMAPCLWLYPRQGSCLKIKSRISKTIIALSDIPHPLKKPPWFSSTINDNMSVGQLERILNKILYETLHRLIGLMSEGYFTSFFFGIKHKYVPLKSLIFSHPKNRSWTKGTTSFLITG